jgi:hypothetical protein
MIGPWAVSRSTMSRGRDQRTAMRTGRSAISLAGNSETSNNSLLAACKFVPPQAIHGLRPIAMIGMLGIISPAA